MEAKSIDWINRYGGSNKRYYFDQLGKANRARYKASQAPPTPGLGSGSPFEGLEGMNQEEMAFKDAHGSWQEGKAEAEGSERAFDATNPFASYRAKYANKLDEFMDDPEGITKTPGYKFALKQGTQAMNRTSAAKGLRMSGNALLEAQEFGQGLASQMRNAEIDRLSGMAGTGQFGGGDYAVKSATAELAGINKGMATIGAEKAANPEMGWTKLGPGVKQYGPVNHRNTTKIKWA